MEAIFILGPTAVGKTDLAFYLSRKIPSVLVSADSIQVYRGADIISGKDNSIPTKLLDIVPPTGGFSVREFVDHVRTIVKEANDEHKVPIIVGGTGFYIDALFGKIDTISIPPNKKIRDSLNELSIEELQNRLKKVNHTRFKSMNNSDVNNKRRLIRAIEVGSSNLKTTGVFKEEKVLMVGLNTSPERLRNRIGERVKKRVKAGALKEAKILFKNFKELAPQLKSASGYKELFDYLMNQTSFEDAIKKWELSDNQLAKRQLTYLRKNGKIRWFEIDKKGFEHKILRLIQTELDL